LVQNQDYFVTALEKSDVMGFVFIFENEMGFRQACSLAQQVCQPMIEDFTKKP
jgi:hypothetical protein